MFNCFPVLFLFGRGGRRLLGMCGRYVQSRTLGWIADQQRAILPEGVVVRESFNVAPTSTVPVIVERPDEHGELHREVRPARWGLLPSWAKDSKMSYKTFNARSETVTEKPTFRAAVRSQRCGIPATAYYEWLKDGDRKIPHAIRPVDHDQDILFAGLWESWTDPATGEVIPSCTILTGASPEHGSGGVLDELAGLHDRLPLPLDEDVRDVWLAPERLEKADVAGLVEQVRSQAFEVASRWEIYEVSRDVGNVRNNSPALLQPIAH